MVEQKRNPFKVWGVTFLWLMGSRIAVMTVFGFVIGFSLAFQHPHDQAAIHLATLQLSKALAPYLVLVTWGMRIAIVILARTGKLPGTRKPASPAEVAAVFADAPSQHAQPIAPAPTPRPPIDLERIEKLGQLHASGILTAEEFAAQKLRLLRAA